VGNETNWRCSKHNETILWGGKNEEYTACVSCLTDQILSLRAWNKRLRMQLGEERRLRGAAQKRIGKLMVLNPASEILLDKFIESLNETLKRYKEESNERS